MRRTRRQIVRILNIKESMNKAYDVNMNNVKIVMNDVIGCVNKYSSDNDQKEKLPLENNEHLDPKIDQTSDQQDGEVKHKVYHRYGRRGRRERDSEVDG